MVPRLELEPRTQGLWWPDQDSNLDFPRSCAFLRWVRRFPTIRRSGQSPLFCQLSHRGVEGLVWEDSNFQTFRWQIMEGRNGFEPLPHAEDLVNLQTMYATSTPSSHSLLRLPFRHTRSKREGFSGSHDPKRSLRRITPMPD